jgi:hypothetical protein
MAASNIDRQDDSVRNARLELEMLQAMNKTHIELHPQLSIFSFSNPLLLAATIGSSLSINRRTAPPPVNLALARIAVVDAEIRHANSRVNAEIESAHQFFALAEAREFAAISCAMWHDQSSGREQLERFVSAKRRTRLDAIRFDQETAVLESTCVEARADVQTAALELVRLVGASASADKVAITTDDLVRDRANTELPAVDDLVKKAFDSREDLSSLSHHVSELAETRPARRPQLDSLSLGYGYLKNSENGAQQISKEYLLGGNVGHLEGGFYLPLRKTGIDAATTAFLQAKFNETQRNLEDLKVSLRRAVAINVQRSALASARLRIARKKQALAQELHQLTTVREGRGLQAESDELWAKRDADRATAEAQRAELEWKQSVFTVLAICEPATVIAKKSVRPDGFDAEIHRVTALLGEPTGPVSSPELLAWNAGDNGMPSIGIASDQPASIRLKLSELRQPPLSSPATLPAPPAIDPGRMLEADNPWASAAALSVPPPRVPAPAPLPGAGGKALTGLPAGQPAAKAFYAPPRPLRRTNIYRTDIAFWHLTQDTSISVQVSIDARGRVTDAIALDDGVPVPSVVLRGRAVAAAKAWLFEPARLRGKPVAAQHVIVFRFQRQTSAEQ